MIAIAATKNAKGQQRRLMVNDVSRAYFYATAIRKVYVEIAEEDREPGDEHMVGELQYSTYGTRDAAQNWQEEFSSMLESVGFKAGRSSPCIFYHEQRDIRTFVHGGTGLAKTETGGDMPLRLKYSETGKEKHVRSEC